MIKQALISCEDPCPPCCCWLQPRASRDFTWRKDGWRQQPCLFYRLSATHWLRLHHAATFALTRAHRRLYWPSLEFCQTPGVKLNRPTSPEHGTDGQKCDAPETTQKGSLSGGDINAVWTGIKCLWQVLCKRAQISFSSLSFHYIMSQFRDLANVPLLLLLRLQIDSFFLPFGQLRNSAVPIPSLFFWVRNKQTKSIHYTNAT